MCRTFDLSFSSNFPLRLMALCLVILSLNGCVAMQRAPDEPLPYYPDQSSVPAKEIEKTRFRVARGDEVIGRLGIVKLEKGDTLPDVARHFSLGVTAISAANPGVDIWVPKEGEQVILPLRFTLPDASRKGIVVNLATMRLFTIRGITTHWW